MMDEIKRAESVPYLLIRPRMKCLHMISSDRGARISPVKRESGRTASDAVSSPREDGLLKGFASLMLSTISPPRMRSIA
jgi:hypothetical protein